MHHHRMACGGINNCFSCSVQEDNYIVLPYTESLKMKLQLPQLAYVKHEHFKKQQLYQRLCSSKYVFFLCMNKFCYFSTPLKVKSSI